jgi:hypothetical protein
VVPLIFLLQLFLFGGRRTALVAEVRDAFIDKGAKQPATSSTNSIRVIDTESLASSVAKIACGKVQTQAIGFNSSHLRILTGERALITLFDYCILSLPGLLIFH